MSTPEMTITTFPASLNESVIIPDSRTVKRSLKIITAAMLILIILASTIVSFYAYVSWTLGNPTIAPLRSNPLKAVGLPYTDIAFPSANGATMVDGWYIPGASSNTVILSHGYGTNREEPWVPMYQLAKELHKNRFNVVMFDYGFAGSSRGVTGGIQESQELLGAVQFAKQAGDDQVYVWGFSMGAGTALQAALNTKDIDGMILDSTFILDGDTMFYNLQQHAKYLPKQTSIFMVNLLMPLVSGYNLNQVPTRAVKTAQYDIPLFLIHGEDDTKAPYQTITSFYSSQKSNPNAMLWLLPNGQHELIYSTHKKEYINRTMKFLYDCVHKTSQSRTLTV